KKHLVNHSMFADSFFSKVYHVNNKEYSPCEIAMRFDEGRDLILQILTDNALNKLSLHDSFVNSIGPWNLQFIIYNDFEFFKRIINNEPVFDKISSSSKFIELLFHYLERNEKVSVACPFWEAFKIPSLYRVMLSSTPFLKNLCSNPMFYKYFFMMQTNKELFAY